MRRNDAVSPPVAAALMVAIGVVLAVLLLLFCLRFFPFPEWEISAIPAIFVISNMIHVDDVTGRMNYDSRLVLKHEGSGTYRNKDLGAVVYRNNVQLPCVIETLNGHDFISTPHHGVQWIGGSGVSGATWLPGETGTIDFTDGTFRPGDVARIDIIDRPGNKIISRHSYRVV